MGQQRYKQHVLRVVEGLVRQSCMREALPSEAFNRRDPPLPPVLRHESASGGAFRKEVVGGVV